MKAYADIFIEQLSIGEAHKLTVYQPYQGVGILESVVKLNNTMVI